MNHSQGTLLYLPLAVIHCCGDIHTLVAYHSGADTIAAGNTSCMAALEQQQQNNILPV